MKYIKLFEEFMNEAKVKKPKEDIYLTNPDEIHAWLYKYNKSFSVSCTIDDNNVVNSLGYVDFSESRFKYIPFQFGNVKDSFLIFNNKTLTTLKGCPTKVGGNFYCRYCEKLTSLKGCPSEVVENFDCGGCINLSNFYYATKKPKDWNACKCTKAYNSLNYNEENHHNPKIHLQVAMILKEYNDFVDILEDLNKKNKLDLIDVDFLIKAILDYPDLADPIMTSNLPDNIKSELKYAINLSKSDVKAKNIFD